MENRNYGESVILWTKAKHKYAQEITHYIEKIKILKLSLWGIDIQYQLNYIRSLVPPISILNDATLCKGQTTR